MITRLKGDERMNESDRDPYGGDLDDVWEVEYDYGDDPCGPDRSGAYDALSGVVSDADPGL